jgi:hypothetical protein
MSYPDRQLIATDFPLTTGQDHLYQNMITWLQAVEFQGEEDEYDREYVENVMVQYIDRALRGGTIDKAIADKLYWMFNLNK